MDEIREQWPKLIADAKIKIRNAESEKDQYLVIVKLLEEFKHSHLSFKAPINLPSSNNELQRKIPLPGHHDSTSFKDQLMNHNFTAELVIDRREDDILYLSFNSFTFLQVGKIKQAISGNRDARGMILDLRNNPGGSGMLACGIALEFCEKDYSLGTMTGPEMNFDFKVVAQSQYYKGPLIILINERSFSTSEIMARGMQVEGEAILVGTPTLGLALPSMIIKLKDGSRFQYPVADFKDAKGLMLEAHGVQPDHLVKITEKDYESDHDPQLEKAVSLILEQTP
jgi:C-terminal processing protease CtpA/Prc